MINKKPLMEEMKKRTKKLIYIKIDIYINILENYRITIRYKSLLLIEESE